MKGRIFDLKEFSIHDGPGCRVTVFLKGCPLRCQWCHNPEGLSSAPQLLFKKQFCTHCGNCFQSRKHCSHPECAPFDRCLNACPNGCLTLSGQTVTVEELARKLLSYKDFFTMTEGGITVSGGEPLMQSEFVVALAQALPQVHKALQTSGYAPPHIYRSVIDCFDYIMQDIKLADPQLHQHYTGVSNEWILENIAYLKQSGKPFVFRVPMIPGITDTPGNLQAIRALAGTAPIEYLPYNQMAPAKYEMLGMQYPL